MRNRVVAAVVFTAIMLSGNGLANGLSECKNPDPQKVCSAPCQNFYVTTPCPASPPSSNPDDHQISTVSEIAENAIKAAEGQAKHADRVVYLLKEYYEKLVGWAYVLAASFGILVTAFGIWEANVIQKLRGQHTDMSTKLAQVETRAQNFDAGLQDLENRAASLNEQLRTCGESLKKVQEYSKEVLKQHKTFKGQSELDSIWVATMGGALHNVTLAHLYEKDDVKRQAYLQQAANTFEGLVNKSDVSWKLRAWGYAYLAHILKRLHRYLEALHAIKSATELTRTNDPGNHSLANYLYNAACYSSLNDKLDQSLDFLKECIALDPKYKVHASADPDFAKLRDNEEFKRIISS